MFTAGGFKGRKEGTESSRCGLRGEKIREKDAKKTPITVKQNFERTEFGARKKKWKKGTASIKEKRHIVETRCCAKKKRTYGRSLKAANWTKKVTGDGVATQWTSQFQLRRAPGRREGWPSQ